MRITLKNIKIDRRLSEETTCFSATLYIDGDRIGTVKNRGTGGCNTYDIPDRDIRTQFLTYAKEWGAENGITFEPEDEIIDRCLSDHENRRVAKANARKGFPFTFMCRRGARNIGEQRFYDEEFLVGLRKSSEIEAYAKREHIDEFFLIDISA